MALRKVVTNMSAYKDKKTGKWYTLFYYKDWMGENKGKTKRGFETKREALQWQHDFLEKHSGNLDINFSAFVDIYTQDMKSRLKLNTWITKQTIIEKKILPYFKDKKINEIKPAHIMAWQNEMINQRDKNGKKYAPTYLKTIHNQLSAICNHAVRFYELSSNPAAKVGNMGKEKTKEMLFWTKEEYKKFSYAIMDKPLSFYVFEILYWCGIRSGELLALTAKDFDFGKSTVRISKSYQRINREDVITEPKTAKSERTIKMPDFLNEEIQEYIDLLYGYKPFERLFPITKSYLHNEMKRGSKEGDVYINNFITLYRYW